MRKQKLKYYGLSIAVISALSIGFSGCGGGGGGGGAVCVEASPDIVAAISGWKVLSRG